MLFTFLTFMGDIDQMKKSIFFLTFVSMLAMFLCCGCSLFRTRIPLEDYIVYSYDGVNEYTELEISVDTERMLSDYSEKIKEKKKPYFEQLLSELNDMVHADKEENLCNGDTVTIYLDDNEDLFKSAGVKFTKREIVFEVEGLKVGTMIDLFEGIVVSVNGIAPLATAEVANISDNAYIQGLEFTLDKTADFNAGDILTVSCNADIDDAVAHGYVFLDTSRAYKADGIDSYVDDVSLLNRETIDLVSADAIETIREQTESSTIRMLYKITDNTNYLFQNNKETLQSMELSEVRLWVCNNKQDVINSGIPFNKLYLIFKAYVQNSDYGSDAYFCFEYNNLLIKPDGSLYINFENNELRYMCDDEYSQLIEETLSIQPPVYTEYMINPADILSVNN